MQSLKDPGGFVLFDRSIVLRYNISTVHLREIKFRYFLNGLEHLKLNNLLGGVPVSPV